MDLQAEGKREEISRLEALSQKQAADISVFEANLKNNQENLCRLREELDDQTKRSGGIEQQILQQKERINALHAELKEIQAQLDEIDRVTVKVSEETAVLEQNKILLLSENSAVLEELRKKDAECGTIRASAEELLVRRENILSDLSAASERIAAVDVQIESAQKKHNSAQEEVAALNNSIQGYLLRQNE